MRANVRTSRRSRGVALVEFTLVALLLFMLVFGIIGYAYMMSFQQSLTQAAAEGARAGAVAIAANSETDARDAVEEALKSYDVECGTSGDDIDCDIVRAACPAPQEAKDCITVTLSYPYRSHPLLPSVPGINLTLPRTLDYTAVAEASE